MQPRDAVMTRLRPRSVTIAAGLGGAWLAAAGDGSSGAVFVGLLLGALGLLYVVGLPPQTFRAAVASRTIDRSFAFELAAPVLVWGGVACATVGAANLVLG